MCVTKSLAGNSWKQSVVGGYNILRTGGIQDGLGNSDGNGSVKDIWFVTRSFNIGALLREVRQHNAIDYLFHQFASECN